MKGRSGMAKLDPKRAEDFTRDLARLCEAHKVMIWTAVKAIPIMVSGADSKELARVKYVVEQPDIGLSTYMIRRVLDGER